MTSFLSAPSPTAPDPGHASPVDPAWDEAFLRVEGYLGAHHLESRQLVNALTSTIIAEARARAPTRPSEPAVSLALAVTHAHIGVWFARADPASDWTNERERAHRRLALVLALQPGRWTEFIFSGRALPSALTAAMASFQFQSGPEVRFTNMPPAPLEFGTDTADDPRVQARGLWQFVRPASAWLLVSGLVAVAWAASR